MDPAVEAWLNLNELAELIPLFASQKLVSFRRIKGLTEGLVRDILPEVGTRIAFMDCLSQLKEDDSTLTTGIRSDSGSITVLDIVPVTVMQQSTTKPNSPSNCSEACKIDDDDDDDDDDEDFLPTPKRSIKQAGPPNVKRKRHLVTSTPRHILSFTGSESIRSLDLKKVIEEDVYSSYVLENYERSGGLSSTDRTAVVHAAVAWMLRSLQVIGAAEFQLMTNKICEIFPDESPGIYFSPPDESHKNFGGKLAARVRNVKYNLSKKKGGALSSSSKSVPVVPNKTEKFTEPAQVAGICDRFHPEVSDAINALTHTSLDSWPLILKHWSTTHALRRQCIIDSRSSEESDSCLDDLEWDVLKSSNGHLLLCQDFKEIFPSRENLLISQWPNVKSKVVALARAETPKTDIGTRQLLQAVDSTPEGEQDALILALIASLCCKRGRGNTSVNLPTPAAAQKALMIHLKSGIDLTRQIKSYISSLRLNNQRFQPTVIVVGPSLSEITASYVQIDESTRYHMRTTLAAVDTCFKIFFALDVKYPSDAYPVWLFIQRFFYNIYIRGDANVSRVDSVISSLKGMTKKQLKSSG